MQQLAIIGLGNPGPRFAHTRHNLGEAVVRQWVERGVTAEQLQLQTPWRTTMDGLAQVTEVQLRSKPDPHHIWVVVPLTFMNNSGEAVAAFLRAHHLEAEECLVVHDEIELNLGEQHFKTTGSAAGHNGVRSIHAALGTQEIARLRIGVGRPADATPVDQFVLGKFTPTETTQLTTRFPAIEKAISDWVAQQLVSTTPTV